MSCVLLLVCGVVSTLESHAAAAPRTEISVPVDSLVRVDDLTGITIEGAVRSLGRDVEWKDSAFELDGWYGFAGVAFSPVDMLRLGAFAGAATLDMGSRDGDYGLLWGLNASLNLVDFVLDESPVFGKKKWIRLMADMEYLRAEPSMDGVDVSLDEFTVAPHVTYAVNFQGADRWHPVTLLGAAIRGGMVFSKIDAEIAEQTYEEVNDFGVMMGVDLQFNEEIGLKLTSYLFADDDMSIDVRFGYYF